MKPLFLNEKMKILVWCMGHAGKEFSDFVKNMGRIESLAIRTVMREKQLIIKNMRKRFRNILYIAWKKYRNWILIVL